MTVNVTGVNQPPHGTGTTVTTLEDTPYVFQTADFGFSDPNDSPANNFLAVEITTLPGAGTLSDNGLAVTAGQFVSVSDISAGKLVFTPAIYAHGSSYASFTFQVEDDGGTTNGGVNTDPTPRTMTVNVTAVTELDLGPLRLAGKLPCIAQEVLQKHAHEPLVARGLELRLHTEAHFALRLFAAKILHHQEPKLGQVHAIVLDLGPADPR